MMLRYATRKDIPRLDRLAREFYKSTYYYERGIPQELDAVHDTMAYLIDGDDGAVLIVETDAGEVAGATGLLVQGLWLAPEHKTGVELFYYVFPEYRKTRAGIVLFNAIETHCHSVGAGSFNMVALEDGDPRIGRLYDRKGFHKVESTYRKEL